MAIQFHPVRQAPVELTTAAQARSHAVAAAGKTTQNRSVGSHTDASETATSFRAVYSARSPSAGAIGVKATPAPASSTAPTASSPAVSTQSTVAATPPASAPAAAVPAPQDNQVLTAEQVFGANPWVTDPTGTGPNGITFGYNPLYFATPSTAAQVAQMVGGKVVEDNEFTKNTPGDPFAQQQANEMVELPDGGLINPGLIASLYTHGLPQWEVNQAIANDVAGAEASVNSIGT
ncbi:MAG TPA: hypothetical protein VLW65_03595 [Bryobacteraceae bacterium]|nr:hypothetical protein [Bryobacteraceae bacterium]